ncbi:hypothetical protein V8F20_011249 [Naviculisporaceae sp. PSN 640]
MKLRTKGDIFAGISLSGIGTSIFLSIYSSGWSLLPNTSQLPKPYIKLNLRMSLSEEAIVGIVSLFLMCLIPVIGFVCRAKLRRIGIRNLSPYRSNTPSIHPIQHIPEIEWHDVHNMEEGRELDIILVTQERTLLSWTRRVG